MQIIELDINDIIPYVNNPRDNSAAIDAVASSIKAFGFNVPLVLDRDKIIVTGHTRLEAAKKLGLKRVPCVIAEHLTEAQAKAYRLADNKVAEFSEWDEEKLLREIEELNALGVDLSEFGFEEDTEEEDPDDVSEFEAPEDAEPVTQPGDLFQLGRHRLLCGDATSAEDLRALTRGAQLAMLLTDPPCRIDDVGHQEAAEPDESIYKFLSKTLKTLDAYLRAGAAVYLWYDDVAAADIYRALDHYPSWQIRQQLVWVQNTLALGRTDYQRQHEPCIYAIKAGAPHYFCDHRNDSTVTEDRPDIRNLSKPELIMLCRELLDEAPQEVTVLRADKPEDADQAVKPVKLFARQIVNSSVKGEGILDPFAGSGTSIIAAEQLGRSAYCLEIDPKRCDRIIKRWEDATGKKARLLCRRS